MGGADWEKKKKKDQKKWKNMSKFGAVRGFSFVYKLEEPDRTYELEGGRGDLNTVSGIAFDERNGVFVLIEDKTGQVTAWSEDRILWQEAAPRGDYEDVAVLGGEIVCLNTNGRLSVRSSDGGWRVVQVPGLSRDDNCEGLCVDGDRLLVACKGETLEESQKRVYEIDFKSERLNPIPVIKISLDEISRVLQKGSEIDQFNPSGIAVHPRFPNHVYIIATSGQLLVVVEKDSGRVLCAVHLPRDPFVQPEGICFTPDGTMYICNEGRAKEGGPGVGTILKFGMSNQ